MSDDFDGLQHPEWPITMMNRLKKKTRRRRKAVRTTRVRRGMMTKTFLVLVFFILLAYIRCGSRSINSQWAAEKLHINRFPCGLMDDIKGKLAAHSRKRKQAKKTKNKIIIPTKQIDRRQRIAGNKLMSSSSIARNSLLDIRKCCCAHMPFIMWTGGTLLFYLFSISLTISLYVPLYSRPAHPVTGRGRRYIEE